MKKLCALLALLLVLSCMPALAARGDAILGREQDNTIYFEYSFTQGDTLYLAAYGTLYTYHVGDADVKPYSYIFPEDSQGIQEDSKAGYDIAVMPFASQGALYAVTLATSYGENTQFEGAKLVELSLQADDTVAMADVYELDWSDLVEYYEENSYPTRPESIIGAGEKAIMRYYDSQGDYKVSAIDLKTGDIEQVDGLRDTIAITGYKDGELLVEQYSYEDSKVVRMLAYDPEGDSLRPLGEVAIAQYNPLQGLAYDAATDTIYCAKGGEICPVDLDAGEVGEGVTDMPLEVYGNSNAASVLDGGYYAFCSEGAVVRNLDPEQRAATRLRINDGTWSESVSSAYYRFANTHGDISVILSRDYSETQNLIENMMNRDDSTDIYVLYTSNSIFDALYNRGYLMELDGSEAIQSLADSMYPSMRACLSSNGHIVGVPLNVSAWTMGINEKALAVLGLTMEDVPDNWPDFLDFLKSLEGKMTEENGVTLVYGGYTASDARNDLFYTLFDDYQEYVNVVNPAMGYNTELLRGLLHKLEEIDFVALGCQPDEDEDEAQRSAVSVFDYEAYDEGAQLLQTGVGCTIGNFYGDTTPLLLGMEAGAPTYLVLDTAVAFINPFTKHPETALAFMEELAENLPSGTLYSVNPSLNEPIRGQWNEEYLKETEEMLAGLRADLEQADAADKQMIEESIRDGEQNLEYFNLYGWEVSPRELEWYRANARDDNVVTARVNWLYADDSGEAWELISQYREAQISAEELLSAIDRKVQMMLLEGN